MSKSPLPSSLSLPLLHLFESCCSKPLNFSSGSSALLEVTASSPRSEWAKETAPN